ncbi:uncharacterized protein LOC141637911 [Silene latifolia]|uniref:uncharacterized protein LOC141637911 n=1 Tax=Silene latifolia TaxID=37657 RepID=UPI003D77AC1B
MGQVFSYIWRRIRRLNNVVDTDNLQNDLLAPLDDQSHRITISDEDSAQPDVVTEEEEDDDDEEEAIQEVIQFTPLEQRSLYIDNPGRYTFQPGVVPEITFIGVDFQSYSVEHEEEDDDDEEEAIQEVTQFTPLEQRSHYIDNPGRYTFQPGVVPEITSIVVDFQNYSVEHEEEKENEEVPEKEIQEVVKKEVISRVLGPNKEYGVSEETVRKIGPYTSMQRILLVGEGDFSFSTSLAVAFGSASNMIATSLNTREYLTKTYRKFPTHKRELETRGCMLIHDVDATTMVRHSVLGKLKFDIIIYNFPHIASFGRDSAHLRKNQKLVRGFIRCAKKMINEDGEIHITHKTSSFYRLWNIPKIGRDEGLHIIQKTEFILSMFPGYHTKYGYRGDKDFHCDPSKTYKFGLRPKPV